MRPTKPANPQPDTYEPVESEWRPKVCPYCQKEHCHPYMAICGDPQCLAEAVVAPLKRWDAEMQTAKNIDKFREESETDSQQTMKSESQYGRAVPHHLGEPMDHHQRTGHAEAEGRKRIEVAQAPSRNRTLESGEAGETKAGGDTLEGQNGGWSVGGLTARRDGQRTVGMQADVTGAYQWPTRECAGGCGRNVSGRWDKCARCEERHEVEHEEASDV